MKNYAEHLEKNLDKQQHELQTVTTKFDTPSVSMAEAIAERFGETRISILRNVIEMGIHQLFLSFDSETRKDLASVADEKTTKFMLSKGARITTVHAIGSFENEWSDWRMEEYAFCLDSISSEIMKNNPELDQYEAIKQAHTQINEGGSC